VHLLAGRGGANLAAASMQLPAGAAGADEWRAQRQADARLQGRGGGDSGGDGGSSGGGGHGYPLSTCRFAGMLTPGAPAVTMAPGASLAESVVLRGARTAAGAPARAPEAAAALDAALRAEPPRRCVVHRATAAAPLAVPLPFPGLFLPPVGPQGDVVATWSPTAGASSGGVAALAAGEGEAPPGAAPTAAASGRDGRHVASCPVLTRVSATSEFAPWLQARAAGLRHGVGGVAGRALAEGWGYGRGELAEVEERLAGMAASYAEAESDDGLDD
jgi:hypothetical protein